MHLERSRRMDQEVYILHLGWLLCPWALDQMQHLVVEVEAAEENHHLPGKGEEEETLLALV